MGIREALSEDYDYSKFEEEWVQISVKSSREIYSPSHPRCYKQGDHITHTKQCRVFIYVKGRSREEIRDITEAFASISDDQLIEKYGNSTFYQFDFSKE